MKEINPKEKELSVKVFDKVAFDYSTRPLSTGIIDFCCNKNYATRTMESLTAPRSVKLYENYAKAVQQLTGTFVQVSA